MGKKGGGRSGFVRSAGPAQSQSLQAASGPPTPAEEQKAAPVEHDTEDPSSKFVKDTGSSQQQAQETTISRACPPPGSALAAELTEGSPEASDRLQETRGQLTQRHKRELKALKDQVKKLGKKRKDDANELERKMEARQAEELNAWEGAHKDQQNKDVTFVDPTAGLYDLKIGNEDETQKKPSKAQKKREQRAAQEAAREARIAEEQASIGVSEREQEASSLEDLLRPLGLQLQEIPADGHCMYRAVHHQLSAAGEDSPPDHKELREETASYMRAFPDDFKPFVLQEEESDRDPEEQYESYCVEVEETAAWGGQVELQALSQALERHILVYAVGMPTVELGSAYKGRSKTLRLCYLRHAYGLGEHYNSVQLIST